MKQKTIKSILTLAIAIVFMGGGKSPDMYNYR